jgi:hypothetical protein
MFKDDKIPKHALQVRTKILRKAKFIIPFARFSCLLSDDSVGRIARELWWTNREFFCDDLIPLWFSMLI